VDYGRGAFARQPAQRSLAEFLDDHCPRLAAAIAYHVLFPLFPLAIMLAGVFGIVVHATGARAAVVDAIVRNVPLSSRGDRRLRGLLHGVTGNLSALGPVGVVGLVYAGSGMMAAIRSRSTRHGTSRSTGRSCAGSWSTWGSSSRAGSSCSSRSP
jgi:uncharacterized BrkB/YihY/UPF0761 family membrane protein